MAHTINAEALYQDLKQLPPSERQKFFLILSTQAFPDEDMSHEALFGHLVGDEFTARDAAEYLEVSITTFRRYVSGGKLNPSSTLGRNQMFAVPALKAFKKALKTTKAA